MSVACKIFDPRLPDWGRQERFVSPQRLILKEELRMKKVLSLVLAFAMILGSFGFVFASNFPDVSDTAYFGEPVNVLTGFGVIAGYPDGTFKPTNVVTRAEMVTMIVAALNIPVKGGATTVRFSDVPVTHWAAGYIDYGASVGFVAGYPDGSFQPEKEVSYNEALTMIVAALGYTAESLPGSWPGNFVNKVQSLGILDICRTTGTAGAPRQDIACFLYQALTQPIGYVNKDGTFVENIGKDGKGDDTMLKRLGGELYDPDDSGSKKAGDPFVVTGEEDAQINLQNYLGAYVTAYANSDGEIVAIKEVLSEYIEGDYAGDLEDTYKFDGAKKVDYISFTNGDKDSSTQDYKQDGIKLAVKLSGKSVKEVYSVQVWAAAGTFRAAEDIQDEITDDQAINGYDFALNDDDEIDAATFAIVGDRADINALAEDDIVTVYLHKNGDAKDKIAKIEVSTKTVEGEVTKITTGSSPKYTVGGTAYKLAADAICATPALEDEGTFFLNYAGKIFDFDAVEGTSNYAIVLAKDSSTSWGTTTYQLRLFLADGTVKEFKADATPFGAATVGDLVKYTVNSSDKITGIAAPDGSAASGKFDKNSIYNTMAAGATTIVFSYNGGDVDSDESYEVLKGTDLAEAEFTGMDYFVSDKAFKAILVSGVSTADDIFAIFVSKDAKTSDGYVWTALYDGKVQDLTLDVTPDPEAYTTGSAVKMYTLTFTSDDIVNKVKEVAAGDYVSKAADVSAATSVSGNVFKDGAKASYSLDSIAVYVYDESDDEWTAKAASALAGRKGSFKSITLIDSDKDGDYDIAIVTKE